jgi:hypothetical protein
VSGALIDSGLLALLERLIAMLDRKFIEALFLRPLSDTLVLTVRRSPWFPLYSGMVNSSSARPSASRSIGSMSFGFMCGAICRKISLFKSLAGASSGAAGPAGLVGLTGLGCGFLAINSRNCWISCSESGGTAVSCLGFAQKRRYLLFDPGSKLGLELLGGLLGQMLERKLMVQKLPVAVDQIDFYFQVQH